MSIVALQGRRFRRCTRDLRYVDPLPGAPGVFWGSYLPTQQEGRKGGRRAAQRCGPSCRRGTLIQHQVLPMTTHTTPNTPMTTPMATHHPRSTRPCQPFRSNPQALWSRKPDPYDKIMILSKTTPKNEDPAKMTYFNT